MCPETDASERRFLDWRVAAGTVVRGVALSTQETIDPSIVFTRERCSRAWTSVASGAGRVESAVVLPARYHLGTGGEDTLVGDDVETEVAYGNDELFGGGGKDILRGGRGFDLLHGGDHRAYGTAARDALVDDGEDTADHKDQAGAIKIMLVATAEGDQTFAATTDFANAMFV
jgi:Ca2+-binding RTX toxin-like protein